MNTPAVPFRILALAPFVPEQAGPGPSPGPSPGPIMAADRESLDDVIQALKPSFQVDVPKEICPAGTLEWTVESLKGFRPDTIVSETPYLSDLMAAKAFLDKAPSQGLSAAQIKNKLNDWPHIPPITIETDRRQDQNREKTSQGVEDILKLVALPEASTPEDASRTSAGDQVDAILRKLMPFLFSNQKFRSNEGLWRGVRCMLDQGDGDGVVSLHLLPVTENNLDDVLDSLVSQLIAEPPSIIVVDFPFDSTPVSLERLQKIALLSETLLAPAICAIGPRFFRLKRWEQVNTLPYLPHYLDDPSFAKWRKLSNSPEGRWLTVTCNGFATRYPYGQGSMTRTVSFLESDFLFSGSVWAMASLITQSIQKTGWPTAFSRWQHIRLEDLPVAQTGGAFPTEGWFNEDRIAQFMEAGITPLVGPKNKDFVFTPGDTTISGDSLSYQLLLSRLSHVILWCKDHMEEDLASQQLQDSLEQAFTLFWEKSGHPGPHGLQVSVGNADSQGQRPVTITLTPSKQVLLSSQPVELNFLW